MAIQTVAGLQTIEGSVEALTELLAGKIGTAGKVRLYLAAFNPGPASVEADFEAHEASFTGYLAVALTWSAVALDDQNRAVAVSLRSFFQATDGAHPNLIGGAWIDVTTAAGPPAIDRAVDYYQFPAPVPLNGALDFVAVTITKRQPDEPGFAIIES